MRTLQFDQLKTVLLLGAHSDDIEIGAGATALKILRENPDVRLIWVVLSAPGERETEARNSARLFLAGAKHADVVTYAFRDGFFPHEWAEIKSAFETFKTYEPDLVFTHHGEDRHQDHRVTCELTWNTFRDHMILEYEIPKFDGGLGSPNFFVPASVADTDRKIEILGECFASQAGKHWFADLTFRGLMRLRGLECRAPEHLAEAFYARKIVMS